jgi:putative Ca2+/H+ antiporter (TMEM165/GDT1 family)
LVALTTTAGAIFPYGLDRWAELAELSKRPTVRVRVVATRVTAIAAVALLAIVLGSWVLLGLTSSTWRGVAILTFTILGGVPAVGVMDGVRRTAGNESALGAKGGEQVAVLLRLRQLLQRLLAAVGSLVALSTLATGALLASQRSLPAGSGHNVSTELPPQSVLVFGGLGSLLVALFYVPAATAIQRRGQRLCDELFPLDKAEDASAILSLAEGRHKLEQLLGVDRGVIADLQTGLAILGPLLASAAAAFLSPP